MSNWNSPEWEGLYGGGSCPICRGGGPNGIVTELKATCLTSGPEAPMRGYCALVLKRHAVEPFELSPEEASAFMRDVQRAGQALQELTGAVKINYEIHGNTIPHLHMHLYPRYRGDPFEGRPIDPRSVNSSPYAAGEFEAFAERLRTRLAIPSSRTRFEHADPILRVENMGRSIRYYTEILGFRAEEWSGDDFGCVTRDGASIYLSLGDQGQPGTWVWVGVEDVASLFEEYEASKADVVQPPTNFPWALEMQVRDPDGHVLRFGSEPRPDIPFA